MILVTELASKSLHYKTKEEKARKAFFKINYSSLSIKGQFLNIFNFSLVLFYLMFMLLLKFLFLVKLFIINAYLSNNILGIFIVNLYFYSLWL